MPTTVLMLAVLIVLAAVPFWLLRGKLPAVRYTSLTGLLLMAVVALSIVVVQFWREIGPLRADVRQMRTQLGRLTIDDRSLVQAIEVRQPDPNLWRWRIYLPLGGQYKLHSYEGILPARGSQSNREWMSALTKAQYGIGSSEFSSYELNGEVTLEASLVPVNGQWKFVTHPGGGESRFTFTDNWPADPSRYEASDVWDSRQRTYNAGEPIMLLYVTKPVKTATSGGGFKTSAPTEPAEGIVLWLEQTLP